MTLREDKNGLPSTYREGANKGTPPDAPGSAALLVRLPSALAAEYTLESSFETRGNEADLYRVSDKAGNQWVAKIYRQGIAPKEEILEKIAKADRRHLVGLEKYGCSDGRWWELQEYIPQESLRVLLDAENSRKSSALVKEILRQLTEALAYLHSLNIEHRDLKPDNILVRSREPFDLVLADFGIASLIEGSIRFTNTARTLKYAPPEALGTQTKKETGYSENISTVVRTRWDYWSLGMIMVESIAGAHPFDSCTDAVIGHRLATIDTDDLVEGVNDPDWRKLCRGLLRRTPQQRWGEEQIFMWLKDPRHLSLKVVAEEQSASRIPGFRFQGREYFTRQDLAGAFSDNWNGAESIWKLRWRELRGWVEHDLGDGAVAGALIAIDQSESLNLDGQIFLMISALDSTALPRFRDLELTVEVLECAVEKALSGDFQVGDWLERLHQGGVLRSIALQTPEAQQLRSIGETWMQNVTDYQNLQVSLQGHGATVRPLGQAELITLLSCSLPVGKILEDLRHNADGVTTADALEHSWFRDLGTRENATPAALLVIPQVAGFAATDGRERRYAHNLAVYCDGARALLGFYIGLVSGIVLAYVPGLLFYYPIKWIWGAQAAFTIGLLWVCTAGVIGAHTQWCNPANLLGSRDRDPVIPKRAGLIGIAIGIVALLHLGSCTYPIIAENYTEPARVEAMRVATHAAEVWATRPEDFIRRQGFSRGSVVSVNIRWKGKYNRDERRFEILFPDNAKQYCHYDRCNFTPNQSGRYELRAIAGGRILAQDYFQVQGKSHP